MKDETKLWLRKKFLMTLRSVLWHADDWLHRQEVALREESSVLTGAKEKMSGIAPVRVVHTTAPQVGSTPAARSHRETFQQWEAQRSGIAPVRKKYRFHPRREKSAKSFDSRFVN